MKKGNIVQYECTQNPELKKKSYKHITWRDILIMRKALKKYTRMRSNK